jgi:hypothetical protein
VPLDVVNGKTFEQWREKVELTRPDVLYLSVEDVLAGEADLVPADYPDTLTLHGVALPLTYRFDPSADDDGVTVTVPLVLLPQIVAGELDWTIPAWHRDKVAALLGRAPKAVRKSLGSVSELATFIAPELTPFSGPMLPGWSNSSIFPAVLSLTQRLISPRAASAARWKSTMPAPPPRPPNPARPKARSWKRKWSTSDPAKTMTLGRPGSPASVAIRLPRRSVFVVKPSEISFLVIARRTLSSCPLSPGISISSIVSARRRSAIIAALGASMTICLSLSGPVGQSA